MNSSVTGYSLSEAHIFASIKPKYYSRLFSSLVQENYKFSTCCVSTYFGLIYARMSASDKK